MPFLIFNIQHCTVLKDWYFLYKQPYRDHMHNKFNFLIKAHLCRCDLQM